MHATTIFAAAAALVAEVAAHGAVTSYKINGVDFPGYSGFSPNPSVKTIERQWPDFNPTTTVTDIKLRCNGGTSAQISASVKPGDSVEAIWQQWTHSQGPIMVWMYKCAGDFGACDGSGKGWFKIDQAGFTPKSGIFLDTEVNSGWAIATLVGGNKGWTSKIPNLAPGNYLIRHELIALHQANNPQFYAECAQLQVTGSGTGVASGSYLASIPGYVSQNDPTIKFNINNHSLPQTYTFPGPAVYGTSAAKKARDFTA